MNPQKKTLAISTESPDIFQSPLPSALIFSLPSSLARSMGSRYFDFYGLETGRNKRTYDARIIAALGA